MAASHDESVDSVSAGRLTLRIVALAAAYAATGRLGLELAVLQDNATLFWPPTGIALAALLLGGLRLWPGVALGAFAVNLAIGTPLAPAVGIAIGNTLEAVLGAWALRRIAGFSPGLERVRDVVALLIVGVAACTVVSASIGVGSLYLAGRVDPSQVTRVWLVWWLGDAGGALVFTPLVLAWRNGRSALRTLTHRAESWLVLGLLVTAGVLGFGSVVHGTTSLFVAFLPFPFVVWAGVRLGPRGAVTASFVIATLAVVGTAEGLGPFAGPDVHATLMRIWAYCTSIGATGLLLAAAIAEREHAQAEQRREHEHRTRLEVKMLEAQRLESLGVLAGGVAHDFNNILAAIRCNADLLRLDHVRDAAAAELVAEIETASKRAGELCQRLLVYAGRGRMPKAPVSLDDLVADLDALVRASIPKNVRIETRCEPGLPTIEADATAVRQVVMNLVINAAEAVAARGGTVTLTTSRVTLSAEDLLAMRRGPNAQPGEYLCVEVRDAGVGIAPDKLRQIFDPFFTTKFTGRGLGLAAVLGIVRGHDGAIDVDSTPGRGTRVSVYFRPSSEPVAQPPAPPARSPTPARAKVLVADDEASLRRAVARLLNAAGFEVVEAEDGKAALDRYDELDGQVDAVLLDVTMPRMGGREVLAVLRERDPHLPVVLMSGYMSDVAEGEVAADEFIQKPPEPGRIETCLRTHIAQARSRLDATARRA